MPRSASQAIPVALISLSILGLHLTVGLAVQNGTIPRINAILAADDPLLPNSPTKLKKDYTGLQSLDYHISSLVLFFWPFASAYSRDHARIWWRFAGDFCMTWMLVILEHFSLRSKKHMAAAIFVGFMMQNVSYAAVLPLVYVYPLKAQTRHESTSSLQIQARSHLLGSTCAVSIGFCTPLLFWVLPRTSLDDHKRQVWIALWQLFPISSLLPYYLFASTPWKNQPSVERALLGRLRATYLVIILSGTILRLASSILFLGSAISTPTFSHVASTLRYDFRALIPYTIPQRISDVDDGLALLLQFDTIVGAAASMLWAVESLRREGLLNARSTLWWSIGSMGFLLSTAALGPAACSVLMIWIRDEVSREGRMNRERLASLKQN